MSLFGSPRVEALGVRQGDEMFIWGAKQGWLGRCIATADARAPRSLAEVPWPDPSKYQALIPMQVVAEPDAPIWCPGPELTRTVGIGTYELKQFPALQGAGADVIATLLGGRPDRISPVEQALEELLQTDDLDIPPGYDERNRTHGVIVQRRGQRRFREGLMRAYGAQCAVTGTAGDAVLEAAHIRPYRGDLHNATSNGLLLRADIHTLFDLHLLTVLPFGTIQVAPSLTDPLYADLNERMVRRPTTADARPLSAALEEHNSACEWLRAL